jgi:hypothetical protein
MSDGERARNEEQEKINRLKREVMRLGEDKLYARYTNIKEK